MITTKYVRENIDKIRESLSRRESKYPIDQLLELDTERRRMLTDLQSMQSERNRKGIEVSELKKAGKDAAEIIKGLEQLKARIAEIEKILPENEERVEGLLQALPNIMHKDVPKGKSDEDNPEISRHGEIRKKNSEPHEAILERLGMLDVESAAKVAGSRFYYLKGDLVLLEQSLGRFAIDEISKKGYTPVLPPYMMRRRYYRGTVPLENFEEMLYAASEPTESRGREDYEKMEDELFMIATAEHPLAAMHAGRTFSYEELPLRYVGISPSFRREAGSHGKDTKGIFRVHQFNKVEQFVISDNNSDRYHEELLANSEAIIEKLGIPYRVIEICTGDLSKKDARSFDIEGYMPSQGRYRELFSCSNCTDWQSMRLDIRYDYKGERRFVHTLNATGVSIERMLVAIIENYSNSNGSIDVPDALVSYMGKRSIGKA